MLENLRFPIVQAPMAGVTTPEFVVACLNAGILGSVGAGYFTAEQTRSFIREVQKETTLPFAVNLFVPEPIHKNEMETDQAWDDLHVIRKKLGVSNTMPAFSKSEFLEQIEVIIDENINIVSFTFGLPTDQTIQLLKNHGVYLIGTATSVEEAMAVEQAGLDAVVIQGMEAGGHRGTFLHDFSAKPISVLAEEVANVATIPIIAAGGISTETNLEEFYDLGVAAVQIGTALLPAIESGASEAYKEAVLSAKRNCTVFTTTFSGKTARGIENDFILQMKNKKIAPYPIQNDLTKEIRQQAVAQQQSGYLSLWAGTNVHHSKKGTVHEIITQLREEKIE